MTWAYLHAFAHQPHHSKDTIIRVVDALASEYPCPECRANLRLIWSDMKGRRSDAATYHAKSFARCSDIRDRSDVQNIVADLSKEHILFVLHNEVNRNLNRPTFPIERFEATYGQRRNVSIPASSKECFLNARMCSHQSHIDQWWDSLTDICDQSSSSMG